MNLNKLNPKITSQIFQLFPLLFEQVLHKKVESVFKKINQLEATSENIQKVIEDELFHFVNNLSKDPCMELVAETCSQRLLASSKNKTDLSMFLIIFVDCFLQIFSQKS